MPTSFEDYVAAELDGLLRYATALIGDPHLAQDIVQDVLLRARPHWPRIHTPGTYLRRMVVTTHASWYRRKGNRDVVAVGERPPDEWTRPVEDPSEGYVERDAMLRRLAVLPDKQRAALVLRYYEDRSDEEIARILRCRPGTVRSQIARALKTLRTNDNAETAHANRGGAL